MERKDDLSSRHAPAKIFCDTSAVAKLYVAEKESVAVRRRFESEDRLFASELVRAELMGVFHRQLREKQWTRENFLTAVRQFEKDEMRGFWSWFTLDTSVIEAVAKTYVTLPATVFLRSSDCIHLVTAVQQQFSEIYTYDVHQINSAMVLGLKPIRVS